MIAILHIAINAMRPMSSYKALALGATVEQLGLLSIAFAALAVVTAIPLGRGIDRWGSRPFAVGASLSVGIAALFIGLTQSLVVVIALQALIGLGLVTAAIAFQTLVAAGGPMERVDERFGTLSAVVSFAQLAGPALAGVLSELSTRTGVADPGDPHGTALVFPVMAAAAGFAAMLATVLPESRLPGTPSGGGGVRDIERMLRSPGIRPALLVSVVVFGCVDLLAIYLPVYGSSAGWSVGIVTALLATRAAATLGVRLFFVPLVRRVDRRVLLATGCAIGAASMVAMPFAIEGALPFVLIAVFGLAVGAGQPLTMAWVARSAPAQLRSTSLGVRLTTNQIWLIGVPPLVGLLIGAAGPVWLFLSIALMLGATVPISAGRR